VANRILMPALDIVPGPVGKIFRNFKYGKAASKTLENIDKVGNGIETINIWRDE